MSREKRFHQCLKAFLPLRVVGKVTMCRCENLQWLERAAMDLLCTRGDTAFYQQISKVIGAFTGSAGCVETAYLMAEEISIFEDPVFQEVKLIRIAKKAAAMLVWKQYPKEKKDTIRFFNEQSCEKSRRIERFL
jgi:hypothetical protein